MGIQADQKLVDLIDWQVDWELHRGQCGRVVAEGSTGEGVLGVWLGVNVKVLQ